MKRVTMKPGPANRATNATVFALLIAFAVAACGAERVRVHVPKDHPAHPDAPAGVQPVRATALAETEPTSRPATEVPAPHEHMHGQGAREAPQTASAPASQPAGEQAYTCPMHPEVNGSAPGRCPKCGMTLVKKEHHR